MSDATDKEQRDAEKKVGKKIKEAKAKIRGLKRASFFWVPPSGQPGVADPGPPPTPNPAPPAPPAGVTPPPTPDPPFDAFKDNMIKKLDELKQKINDHKYGEADDLIEQMKKDINGGFQPGSWAPPGASGGHYSPNTGDLDIKAIVDALQAIEDEKDENLWAVRVSSSNIEAMA
jgi:hypothetical protein